MVDPVDYPAFVGLLRDASLVLTDSGGIQEEAAFLGRPVLVLRDNTERPEGLASGHSRLVGTDPAVILRAGKIRVVGEGAATILDAGDLKAPKGVKGSFEGLRLSLLRPH